MTKNRCYLHSNENAKIKGAAENTAPFLYFKFIAHAIDAFHIFRQVGGYPELLSKIAYVIVDRFPGIVGIVLMPYQFQKHFIGEYSLGVQYEQSKNLKFLNR